MVVVESAGVLRQAVDLSAERAPCPSVDGVAVGCTVDVWASVMDCGVNHVRRSVEETVLTAVNDFACMIDQLTEY